MNKYQSIQKLGVNDVIVLPTDTVYGLACSAWSPDAVARMYAIKRRDGKPGTIIAANADQLYEMGFAKDELARAEAFWPGPVSVILSANSKLAYLHMGKNSLAVRIPADEYLRKLLLQTGPLATTSANFTGEPTVATIEQAKHLFGSTVDHYVDGGDLSERRPSQIIRFLEDGSFERLR
jgi:L-threonylcarbamoyladenylate synthase